MKYCKYCGSEMSDDHVFCTHCGYSENNNNDNSIDNDNNNAYPPAPAQPVYSPPPQPHSTFPTAQQGFIQPSDVIPRNPPAPPKKRSKALLIILLAILFLLLSIIAVLIISYINYRQELDSQQGSHPESSAGAYTRSVSQPSSESSYSTSRDESSEEDAVIYFKKPDSWSSTVYAYVYADDSRNALWPGELMISEGNGLYRYYVSSSLMEDDDAKVVFSDGTNQYPSNGGFLVINGRYYNEYYTENSSDESSADTSYASNDLYSIVQTQIEAIHKETPDSYYSICLLKNAPELTLYLTLLSENEDGDVILQFYSITTSGSTYYYTLNIGEADLYLDDDDCLGYYLENDNNYVYAPFIYSEKGIVTDKEITNGLINASNPAPGLPGDPLVIFRTDDLSYARQLFLGEEMSAVG